jgi:hypothetical protein
MVAMDRHTRLAAILAKIDQQIAETEALKAETHEGDEDFTRRLDKVLKRLRDDQAYIEVELIEDEIGRINFRRLLISLATFLEGASLVLMWYAATKQPIKLIYLIPLTVCMILQMTVFGWMLWQDRGKR